MATLIDTRDPRRHPEMLTNQSLVRPQFSLAATTPNAAPAATPTAASPGTTPAPATPPAPAPLADVARQGNSYSGGNVSGPITVNGQAPGGSYTESLGTQPAAGGARPLSALAAPTPNADAVIAASTRLNQGAGVIDGAGGDARQRFFDEANLRNASAQGSWSPRRGFQGNDTAVAAASIPLVNRARQQLADTASSAALQRTQMEQTGADNRAASAERAADARFGIANQQQQVQNSLAERRLGIEDRRATAAEAAAGVPSGYQRTADGGLTFIKGGPADPNTPKGKNSLTEDQAKSAGYAVRMENALNLINGVGQSNPGATRPGVGTAILNTLPEGVANTFRSGDRQRVESAQLDALDAALTLNTGAAYTREQLQGLSRSYFAQPGDDDKVVADKQQRLNSLIDTARLRAGPQGSNLADNAIQTSQQRAGQPAAQAATAGAASAPSLPAGMSRQVGTSGGKPVYEDAQGNRFIGG